MSAAVLWDASVAVAQDEQPGPIVVSAVVDGPVVEGDPIAVTYLVAGTVPLLEVEPSSSVCGNLGRTPDAGDGDPDGTAGVLDVGEVWVFACVAEFSGSKDFVSVIAEDSDGNVLGPEFVTLELAPSSETPESTTSTTAEDSQTTTTSADGEPNDSTTSDADDGDTDSTGDSSDSDDSSTTAIAIAVGAVALLCLLLLVVWLMRRKKLLPAPEERLYID